MKANKAAIVSIRLAEAEQAQLRRFADERDSTVSDVIREFVRRAISPPLPQGESVGYPAPTPLGTTANRLAPVVWFDGLASQTWPAFDTA